MGVPSAAKAETLPAREGGTPPSLGSGARVALALDLGGTHLKGGVVSADGAHAFLESRETHVERGYAGVLEEMLRFVGDLADRAVARGLDVVGIGVGAPGPLNRESGVVEFAPNLGWRDAPLGPDLARRSGFRHVRIENDANAATYADAWAGEGRGARCVLGVTLGTGIGGGIVIDGRVFAGAAGAAGELGHLVVVADGRPCTCGKRGCLESYFSVKALLERPHELVDEHPDHGLDLDDLTPAELFAAWWRGDPLAGRVVDEGLDRLAQGLAAAIDLMNPDRVVFFGGLTGSWDLFGDALIGRIRGYVLPPTFDGVCFSRSRLRWAGVLGAGGLLLEGAREA